MTQNVVADSHQCIFFSKHLPVFADNSQTVYVRVHNKTDIGFGMLHQVGDLRQVFRDRFRIMCKVTVRSTMQLENFLYPQSWKQFRNNNTAYRVYTVDSDTEISSSDSLDIHQIQLQHTLDVLLIVSIIDIDFS